MPFTTQSYPESETLEAVRQRLVEVLELDDSYVRLVANDNYTVTAEDRMVVIRPMGRRPEPNAGAGRRARPSSRTLRVYMYFRDNTDFAGDDRFLLQQAFDFEDSVINALDDFWPLDSSDNPLTLEPLHIMDSGGGALVRESVNDVGLCRCWLDFEYRSLSRNSTPEP